MKSLPGGLDKADAFLRLLKTVPGPAVELRITVHGWDRTCFLTHEIIGHMHMYLSGTISFRQQPERVMVTARIVKAERRN